MRCPNCENENRDQAKFCDECGFPLTGAIARAAIEPLPDEQDAVLVEVGKPADESVVAPDDAEPDAEQTQRIDVAPEDFEVEEAPEDPEPSEEEGLLGQSEKEEDLEIPEEPESPAAQVEDEDVEEEEPAQPFDEQATEVIGADLSGFD